MARTAILHNGNEIRDYSRVLVEVTNSRGVTERLEGTAIIWDSTRIVVEFPEWNAQLNGQGVEVIENNIFNLTPSRIIGEVL